MGNRVEIGKLVFSPCERRGASSGTPLASQGSIATFTVVTKGGLSVSRRVGLGLTLIAVLTAGCCGVSAGSSRPAFLFVGTNVDARPVAAPCCPVGSKKDRCAAPIGAPCVWCGPVMGQAGDGTPAVPATLRY